MTHDLIDQIAHTVLYEGFLLYPYRASLKNRHRWTFGGLHPRSYSEAHGSDPWLLQTQCLLRATESTVVHATVRFLHPLDRRIMRFDPPLPHRPQTGEPVGQMVESLEVGSRTIHAWHEAVERGFELAAFSPAALANRREGGHVESFAFPASRAVEVLDEPDGSIPGAIVRQHHAIAGTVELSAEALQRDLFRITLRFGNHSPIEPNGDNHRQLASLCAFASPHAVLTTDEGEFISLTDPPPECRDLAAQCENRGVWPVLVGEPGDKHTILAAPIILVDYPQVAEESFGDFFDSTEIDEVLTLRILTLSVDEKREMAAFDERSRLMLERTESLAPHQLMQLHAGMRRAPRPQE